MPYNYSTPKTEELSQEKLVCKKNIGFEEKIAEYVNSWMNWTIF